MRWRSSKQHWGWISIAMHWLTALAVFSLFGLGLWMTELDYYDAWYRKGPALHKSLGILLFILTMARLAWRRLDARPAPLSSHTAREQKLAPLIHKLLYVLLLCIMLFGYLISTADGRAIEVFNWFAVPATIYGFDKQEDIAGLIHLWLAVTLISLTVLHALAALKHHVLDKDRTLRRIFGQ